jgi:hypothetical protein
MTAGVGTPGGIRWFCDVVEKIQRREFYVEYL